MFSVLVINMIIIIIIIIIIVSGPYKGSIYSIEFFLFRQSN